jgi:hypothetical protein
VLGTELKNSKNKTMKKVTFKAPSIGCWTEEIDKENFWDRCLKASQDEQAASNQTPPVCVEIDGEEHYIHSKSEAERLANKKL